MRPELSQGQLQGFEEGETYNLKVRIFIELWVDHDAVIGS